MTFAMTRRQRRFSKNSLLQASDNARKVEKANTNQRHGIVQEDTGQGAIRSSQYICRNSSFVIDQ